ncbi:MAG TPA: hypothetical protein VHF22_05690 [Planctomycetota bacterium]|nr:hypothetical protein [Planctomycetota bacterium]
MHRLTFGLKLLVAFFACDALVRIARIGELLLDPHAPLRSAPVFLDRYFPLVLELAIDALLAGLIALRTRSGRFWGIIFLGALAGLQLFRIVADPGRWEAIPATLRLRELATVILYVVFLAILTGRKAGRVLVR